MKRCYMSRSVRTPLHGRKSNTNSYTNSGGTYEQEKPFEHEIDPELLAEIEEWEQREHDEPEEYFFPNPDPYLKPASLLYWQLTL